jgi:branched-subunit amino acid aminotransferase/4-amino-4-deoxychorismate lyase
MSTGSGQPASCPLAYLNGQLVNEDRLSVAVYDAGFVLGAVVAEQLRTFSGRLFQLDSHLRRLERSLAIVGVDPGRTTNELREAALSLVACNHSLLAPGDDLGLSIFVTPGPYPTFAPCAPRIPTVAMHTYALPFHFWADAYQCGRQLWVSSVRQVPPDCWPAVLKCRSRMHYYLADREAQQLDPSARALLLDQNGYVGESSTANVLAVFADEGLVSPREERILPGISLATVKQLAASLRLPFSQRDLLPEDLEQADELLLCSTSPCILPVCRLNGKPLGGAKPGPIFSRLLKSWSELVGLDIAEQARRFAPQRV